jgi:hypothetical protein
MEKIQIDWPELEQAFENHAPDLRSYMDKKSGRIHAIAGAGKDDDPIVLQIQAHPTQYVPVEPLASREQYMMMEAFIESSNIPILKTQLADAIVGKGAFRRFKDVVSRHSDERKRWFAFRDVLLHKHILDWVKKHNLEPAELPEWSLDLPAPLEIEEDGPSMADSTPEPQEAALQDADALRAYLHAWARSHGDEYRYLFGPSAFERLSHDICAEFTFFRRRGKG